MPLGALQYPGGGRQARRGPGGRGGPGGGAGRAAQGGGAEGHRRGSQASLPQAFDDFIFAFFAAEMLIKMVALGLFGQKCYLGDTWNRLDFFIVMAGYGPPRTGRRARPSADPMAAPGGVLCPPRRAVAPGVLGQTGCLGWSVNGEKPPVVVPPPPPPPPQGSGWCGHQASAVCSPALAPRPQLAGCSAESLVPAVPALTPEHLATP